MQFGFTLKPDHSLERTIDLTRRAEAAGFEYGWLFDSHVLWREPYVLLTLMAQATERMRLGTCVTNPATREPSVTASALAVLDELSGGRMDLGIGRGDSARRVLGKSPTTMVTLEEAIVAIKGLVEGRSVTYEGMELRMPWTGNWTLKIEYLYLGLNETFSVCGPGGGTAAGSTFCSNRSLDGLHTWKAGLNYKLY